MKIKIQLAVMMLFQYTIWGAWYVTLSSYLGTTLQFEGTQIGLIYGSFALAAIISPAIVGVLSDKLFSAQKVLGVLHVIGAVLLIAISYQHTYQWFYIFVFIYALCYMPTIALTNTIAMRHLKRPDKDFANIRVFGTIGWIVMGWVVAYYKLELSASPILIASLLSFILGAFAFLLPKTLPESIRGTKGIKQWLGLDALSLFKNRSFMVLIIASLLVSIPLSFYYSFTNLFLNDIGVENAAGKMTLGQLSEIGFMLLLPVFFRYFGIKRVMIIAMFAWGIRYLFFAYGSIDFMALLYLGIIIHGICYDFFFVAGQVYVDQNSPNELKNSAQGLLTQATYGVGMFLGTWLSGRVVDYYTINEVYNWQKIWIIPSCIAFGVMLLFALVFKNKKEIIENEINE
ncbi:nucleoside permease [Flavivirga spongiicola]|uniref:Nucleoside permease n=1 Tax=Flavivirga spongiicola TaxID=421621 RepID=A0ABU7XQP1_9FLAO|nr:nucleoside permease [Flavivirga sp. MEBiC05379]MDO5978087.1 nucleoside permease [Flavivirga sp. MEBiC05379]